MGWDPQGGARSSRAAEIAARLRSRQIEQPDEAGDGDVVEPDDLEDIDDADVTDDEIDEDLDDDDLDDLADQDEDDEDTVWDLED
jgi:hypothetical protein